jgi:zona occludens toxin
MSIKLYTGRMGSGKSYEVVTVVILDAIRNGRRVVTNIAGINYGLMRSTLAKEGVELDSIGRIVSVDHDDVLKDTFWLVDQSSDDSFIEPGDLLVLDEVWRFWEGFASPRMPEAVLNFFRMHRHFVNEKTGITCDVALISQDINDIGRKVKTVIEETYYMEKLTVLGSSKRYRVDVYSGQKKYRSSPVRSFQRAYNPDFFGFYSSHSQKNEDGVDAKEVNIDGRGNLLKSPFFKFVLPIVLVLMIWGGSSVWGFFHQQQKNKIEVPSVEMTVPGTVPSIKQPVRVTDEVSLLFASGSARLVVTGSVNGKPVTVVEFTDKSGGKKRLSEYGLLLSGWRVFYSPDFGEAVLFNGTEVRSVQREIKSVFPKSRFGM